MNNNSAFPSPVLNPMIKVLGEDSNIQVSEHIISFASVHRNVQFMPVWKNKRVQSVAITCLDALAN